VLEITPNNAEAYNNLGTIYRNLGDRPKAAALFEKAISLAPGTYRFYSNLGVVRQDQGDYAAAVQALEKAAALNEKDYRVWMNLAQVERWLGDAQKAKGSYAHALPLVEDLATRQPQDAIIQAVLGRLYAGLQPQPGGKALPHLESALALAPKDGFVLEIAAVGYEALGNRSMAIDCVTRAVRGGKPLQQLAADPWLRDVLADPNFKPTPTSSKSKPKE
jgi:Flp pilus assembly protein TadD